MRTLDQSTDHDWHKVELECIRKLYISRQVSGGVSTAYLDNWLHFCRRWFCYGYWMGLKKKDQKYWYTLFYCKIFGDRWERASLFLQSMPTIWWIGWLPSSLTILMRWYRPTSHPRIFWNILFFDLFLMYLYCSNSVTHLSWYKNKKMEKDIKKKKKEKSSLKMHGFQYKLTRCTS